MEYIKCFSEVLSLAFVGSAVIIAFYGLIKYWIGGE
jgi:hypothetical protein